MKGLQELMKKIFSELSPRGRIIFYVAVGFLAAAIIDGLFLGPAFGRLSVIDGEISQQENSIIRDLRFLSYKEKILTESQFFTKYYSFDDKERDVIINEFLGKVERLAAASNINIVRSSPTDTKKSKGYVQYYANIDCIGQLQDMIKFMYLINTTEDLLKVVRFNMTQKRGEGSVVTVLMSIVKIIVPAVESNA